MRHGAKDGSIKPVRATARQLFTPTKSGSCAPSFNTIFSTYSPVRGI